MGTTGSRVLDVGNCGADHSGVCRLLAHFDATVDQATLVDDAIEKMQRQTYDLVLVNRVIFADSSEGMSLIRRMKADHRLRNTPVMMISNYPEAQDCAIEAGALPGFGKQSLNDAATLELLRPLLTHVKEQDGAGAVSKKVT